MESPSFRVNSSHGCVDLAIQGVHKLATGVEAEALETIPQAITYLENQRSWMGSSDQWQHQGYPEGLGMIERAAVLVINRCMKKRGMCWCRPNATAVVALRTELLTDDRLLPQRLRSFP